MKTRNISYFKTHISQELKSVRSGESIIIVDRDIPVAEVTPFSEKPALPVRLPVKKLSFRNLSFTVIKDPLEMLMEERGNR